MSSADAKTAPEAILVEVALPLPMRQTFTYRISPALRDAASIGTRAVVPFSGRVLTGYIVSFPESNSADLQTDIEYKDVEELLDKEPLLSAGDRRADTLGGRLLRGVLG